MNAVVLTDVDGTFSLYLRNATAKYRTIVRLCHLHHYRNIDCVKTTIALVKVATVGSIGSILTAKFCVGRKKYERKLLYTSVRINVINNDIFFKQEIEHGLYDI